MNQPKQSLGASKRHGNFKFQAAKCCLIQAQRQKWSGLSKAKERPWHAFEACFSQAVYQDSVALRISSICQGQKGSDGGSVNLWRSPVRKQLLRIVLWRHSLSGFLFIPVSLESVCSWWSDRKAKCLGSSLFPPRYVQSQMQTVHLMNIYGKKKKKKRLIKRKCWSKVRRTLWCWKAAEEPPREGDQESCLDFVSKWFHPRLMVSEWSQILNLIFF